VAVHVRTHDSSHLELHHDGVDDACDRGPAGVDNEARSLFIQMMTIRVQLMQATKRITYLQKRPLRTVAHPSEKILWRRSKIYDGGSVRQYFAILIAQNDTASGCKNSMACFDKFSHDSNFDVPEGGLATLLEE
jgi:hypothetical protein